MKRISEMTRKELETLALDVFGILFIDEAEYVLEEVPEGMLRNADVIHTRKERDSDSLDDIVDALQRAGLLPDDKDHGKPVQALTKGPRTTDKGETPMSSQAESDAKQGWKVLDADTEFKPTSEELTDGSEAWSVFAIDPKDGVIMDFKCVDGDHARHLADVLAQCVMIEVDGQPIWVRTAK